MLDSLQKKILMTKNAEDEISPYGHIWSEQSKHIFHISYDSDDSEYTGETLPIPAVQYEWGDAFTSSTPIGRYSCSTISRSGGFAGVKSDLNCTTTGVSLG